MDDELDLDVEDAEAEAATAAQDNESAALKKVRREAASYRVRAKEAEELVSSILTERLARFADVEPDGLGTKARLSWLEKMEAKYPAAPAQASSATAEADAEAQEAPSEAEVQLAAASGSPATGTTATSQVSASEYTPKQILEIGKADPRRAQEIIAAKYRP